jgi:DNA polymerase III subunit epsilon
MREIVFDTETTGLEFENDRVIEIGAVELWNGIPTGKTFHHYIRPENRKVHPDALAIHGISDEMLADKPLFGAVVEEFEAFFAGARLVAHNATFDVRFLNAELTRLGRPTLDGAVIVDTLQMARRKFPMAPATLDALCSRFGVDTSRRDKHGALLDSWLLAEVYIELIGGRQAALGLVQRGDGGQGGGAEAVVAPVAPRPVPLKPRLDADALERHRAFAATLKPEPMWWDYWGRPEAETRQAAE